MIRKELILLICFILLIGTLWYVYHTSIEGFTDKIKKGSTSPELATYELITSVIKPIRRLTSIVLNPSEWKDRVNMATMSPVQLARMYLQSKQKTEG